MRQLTRLLRYLAPYSWQFIPSVVLLAGVGFLDAFRAERQRAASRAEGL
jgi:hypothetical protein